MTQRSAPLLESRRLLWIASTTSLLLGLFFVFVWSPLPWGWLGIDHYDDRAVRLAAGLPFDTTDVPWGYAYYLAAFYRLVGHAPVAPLIGQVVANAAVPLLLFGLAHPLVGRPAATLAALLTGLFSFNTVYAATQSSDAICTVIFVTMMWVYLGRRGAAALFATGLLAGLAAQFRPNLLLFPLLLGAIELWRGGSVYARVSRAALLVTGAALALTPWVVRNYGLTGEFMPTSTHGGVQLWYGSLQTGPFLESRAHNPRSAFESPPFDYTVLANRSIVITAQPHCAGRRPSTASVVYWTDRNPMKERRRAVDVTSDGVRFEVPGQPAPTTLYYFLEASWEGRDRVDATPQGGEANPLVFFVTDQHLLDMDRHDDLLDVFDLVRLLRWDAWGEPPRAREKLDLTRDGRLDREDLIQAVAVLSNATAAASGARPGVAVTVGDHAVTLELAGGSWLSVPREFSGRLTDLEASGDVGRTLLYARRPFTALFTPEPTREGCTYFEGIEANRVFYRLEPHAMRRYTALALDNIGRDPLAFAIATLYRAGRLFVIRGSSDRQTTQQFAGSQWVYAAGTLASATYALLLVVGVIIAWRRGLHFWPLLLPIVYVPLTIAPVLTNMRYTLTAQPFVMVFVALAVLNLSGVSTLDTPVSVRRVAPAPRDGGSRTTPPP